jgi:hypothetical protein
MHAYTAPPVSLLEAVFIIETYSSDNHEEQIYLYSQQSVHCPCFEVMTASRPLLLSCHVHQCFFRNSGGVQSPYLATYALTKQVTCSLQLCTRRCNRKRKRNKRKKHMQQLQDLCSSGHAQRETRHTKMSTLDNNTIVPKQIN